MASLTTYRRAFGLLSGYYRGTATAGASNTTSRLECTTSCAVTGLRFKSTVNSSSLFEDKWLYRPAAAAAGDVDRRIDAYDPDNGYLDPDDTWTNAPASENFEIYPGFSGTTINELVNEVLRRLCFLNVEVTTSVASTQTRRHSLASAASWLTNPGWVRQVGYLGTGESRNQVNPFKDSRQRRGEAHNESDGSVVYLEGDSLTFNTTDTVYIKATKPAYYHCRASGGAYGDRTGLAAETHEAPPDEEWVAWGVVLRAWDRDYHTMAAIADARAKQGVLLDRQYATKRFNDLRPENYLPAKKKFVSVRFVGPSW